MQRNLRRRALAVRATRSFLDAQRLCRNRNADPVARNARRRARLPGAEPRQPGTLLRAAAIAAASEAAPDGERLRPLLPDRAMLSRRGPARQPPARVQPDRYRDDLPAHRRRGGDRRGHDGGDLPSRARGRAEAAVFAPAVRRGDGTFRRRQAGHALRDGAQESRAPPLPARSSRFSPTCSHAARVSTESCCPRRIS